MDKRKIEWAEFKFPPINLWIIGANHAEYRKCLKREIKACTKQRDTERTEKLLQLWRDMLDARNKG